MGGVHYTLLEERSARFETRASARCTAIVRSVENKDQQYARRQGATESTMIETQIHRARQEREMCYGRRKIRM